MFYIVFEVKELFISPEPDVWLRWDLDKNVAFKMVNWFTLKNQNWKLLTCDSFPLIVSQIVKTMNAIQPTRGQEVLYKLYNTGYSVILSYHTHADRIVLISHTYYLSRQHWHIYPYSEII